MASTRTVTIIGAPLDLGQSRRGVDMGPSAIRYAGLEERLAAIGVTAVDRGNVVTNEPEALAVGDERARYLDEILDACARLATAVADVVTSGRDAARPRRRPLGRDRDALGHGGGGRAPGRRALDRRPRRPQPARDEPFRQRARDAAGCRARASRAIGSRTTGSVLPAVDPARVAIVGARSLDPGERELIRAHGIRVFTMSEIDRIGIERAVTEALARVAGPGFVHVSLDLDALDPEVAPGVGTPVRGGLTYREAHLACELVAESGLVGSLELVEVNPILDRENTTALTAVELVASALGQDDPLTTASSRGPARASATPCRRAATVSSELRFSAIDVRVADSRRSSRPCHAGTSSDRRRDVRLERLEHRLAAELLGDSR